MVNNNGPTNPISCDTLTILVRWLTSSTNEYCMQPDVGSPAADQFIPQICLQTLRTRTHWHARAQRTHEFVIKYYLLPIIFKEGVDNL